MSRCFRFRDHLEMKRRLRADLPNWCQLGYSMRVKAMKTFVSVLLLSFFGLSLAADAFASDSMLCLGEVAAGLSASDTSPSQVLSQESESHESENADCSDPCHYGRCHFGHCSVVFSNSYVRLQVLDLDITVHSLKQSMIEAPFLEGPRRPPRLT